MRTPSRGAQPRSQGGSRLIRSSICRAPGGTKSRYARLALSHNPRYGFALRFLAAALVLLGRRERATEVAQLILKIEPGCLAQLRARHPDNIDLNYVNTIGMRLALREFQNRSASSRLACIPMSLRHRTSPFRCTHPNISWCHLAPPTTIRYGLIDPLCLDLSRELVGAREGPVFSHSNYPISSTSGHLRLGGTSERTRTHAFWCSQRSWSRGVWLQLSSIRRTWGRIRFKGFATPLRSWQVLGPEAVPIGTDGEQYPGSGSRIFTSITELSGPYAP